MAKGLYREGSEPTAGSLKNVSNKKKYRLTKRIKVDNKPLYAVAFNFIDARFNDVIAIAGGNKVTVYHCTKEGAIIMMQRYEEEGEESYYTVSWASNLNGDSFIVAGGQNGFIRIIDVGTEKLHMTLLGHGQSINDIKTQEKNPSLIVSASKDESVRVWNIHTGVPIFILAGEMGHRFEVLSVDFHQSDVYKIVSCGMDCTIKIWSLEEFWENVENSFTWTDQPSKFPTKCIQFPLLTFSVHNEFVDCNKWIGNYILSKSVENELLLWNPEKNKDFPNEGEPDVLHEFPAPDCNLWFLKFSCDFHLASFAVGTCFGDIYVWTLNTSPPVLLAKLSHSEANKPIRQTSMSFDGSTILACDDDGYIWRWDEKKVSEIV